MIFCRKSHVNIKNREKYLYFLYNFLKKIQIKGGIGDII